jgi:drug/metabolite transporter (DMT)-like permease
MLIKPPRSPTFATVKPVTRSYIFLHTAVLLFGVTAILGKLISIQAIPLVWHRLWISSIGLILVPGVLKGLKKIDWRDKIRFTLIGCIVATHWVTFYHSIKLGDSASITLACLATTTLFTSILEPLITKSTYNPAESILGVFVLVGIYFITQVDAIFYSAIVVGLISAFFAALFSTLNKKYISNHNSLSVSWIELTAGFLVVSVVLPIFYSDRLMEVINPVATDWLWLVLLGLVCTSLAFALALEALKNLSAFISNLSINLEPVYGIILAALIFQENKELDVNFYIGTTLILLAVAVHPFITRYQKRKGKKDTQTILS